MMMSTPLRINWPKAKLFVSHSQSAAAYGDYDVSNEEDNRDYDDHEILRIM